MKKWLLGMLALLVLGCIGNWLHDAMLQGAIDKYTSPSLGQKIMGIKNSGLDGKGGP